MLTFSTLFSTLTLLIPLALVSGQDQPTIDILANNADQTTFRVDGGIADGTQFEIHYKPVTGDLKNWERSAVLPSGEKKTFPPGPAKWEVHVPGFATVVNVCFFLL